MNDAIQWVTLVGVGALLSACSGGIGPGETNQTTSIVGEWRGATTIGCLGEVDDDIVFKPDGRFSRLTTSSEVNCVPYTLMVHTTGNYEVEPSIAVINLTNIDTEPKQQCLPGGCQPIATVTADALDYTLPDSNTLTLSCGPSCVTTYHRVL